MPQVDIHIGGRVFAVACQEGEERYLHSAAAMLDNEAQSLSSQVGRMSEGQLLLMSGLMLADKTTGLEDKLRAAEAKIAELELRANRPAERVEVPVIPGRVMEAFAELAAEAEALAGLVEEKARG